MGISGDWLRIIDEIAMSGNKGGLNMIVTIRTKDMGLASRFTQNEAHIVQTSLSN